MLYTDYSLTVLDKLYDASTNIECGCQLQLSFFVVHVLQYFVYM